MSLVRTTLGELKVFEIFRFVEFQDTDDSHLICMKQHEIFSCFDSEGSLVVKCHIFVMNSNFLWEEYQELKKPVYKINDLSLLRKFEIAFLRFLRDEQVAIRHDKIIQRMFIYNAFNTYHAR